MLVWNSSEQYFSGFNEKIAKMQWKVMEIIPTVAKIQRWQVFSNPNFEPNGGKSNGSQANGGEVEVYYQILYSSQYFEMSLAKMSQNEG